MLDREDGTSTPKQTSYWTKGTLFSKPVRAPQQARQKHCARTTIRPSPLPSHRSLYSPFSLSESFLDPGCFMSGLFWTAPAEVACGLFWTTRAGILCGLFLHLTLEGCLQRFPRSSFLLGVFLVSSSSLLRVFFVSSSPLLQGLPFMRMFPRWVQSNNSFGCAVSSS